VIASKSPLPILECFLFRLERDKLAITASDVETRMETSVGVINSEGSGVFAVSAKILLEPLKELPEQPLTFEIDEETMNISLFFHNGEYNFTGEKGDVYPQQKPLQENAVSLSVDSQVLLSSISRSLFATADDELRPVMNGIYFDIHTEDLTIVASDGHKLVRLRNLRIHAPAAASFILPKKPAMLLKSILSRETEEIKITFDENNAILSYKSFEMVCRLIEGRYPNYNSVIPQDNPLKVTIDRVSLWNALKRVSVFSNASTSLVRLQLKANEIVVSAQDVDFSRSAEEKITCRFEGEELTIGFKSTFLIEMLGNIVSREIVLELADPSRAGVIVPAENEENEELLMLLMPMMLNN
jgi:DNA polymerase-3 subunit beta